MSKFEVGDKVVYQYSGQNYYNEWSHECNVQLLNGREGVIANVYHDDYSQVELHLYMFPKYNQTVHISNISKIKKPVSSLDFTTLRKANDERQLEWDPNNSCSLLYRATELGGETGELLNEIKKYVREQIGLVGSRTDMEKIRQEGADVVICVDLLFQQLELDLGQAVKDKFNLSSEKNGLKTRIE